MYAGSAGATACRSFRPRYARRHFAPGKMVNLENDSIIAPILQIKKGASQRGERRLFLSVKLVAGAGFNGGA
jgi:hypothetical protein